MARSPLFDIYDPYGALGAERLEDLLPEEEKVGMLRNLANMGSSGLSAFGWLLDTPGAIVRGVLAGDPLSGFGSSEDRVTGRELLRQYGLAGEEDTWGNFGGGMATEILLDPLSYASLGLFAFLGQGSKTAAFRAAAKAGITPDDFALAADRAVNAGRPGITGRATWLRRSTPQTLIDDAADPAKAMEDWMRFAAPAPAPDVQGVVNSPGFAYAVRDHLAGRYDGIPKEMADVLAGSYGQDLLQGLRAPLARSHRVGLPWGDGTAMDLFGEGFGDFAARTSDTLRRTAFNNPYTGPALRTAQALFDARVQGFDNEFEMLGRTDYEARQLARRQVREELARMMVPATRDLGLDTINAPRFVDAVANYLEGQYGQIPQDMADLLATEYGQNLVREMRGGVARELARAGDLALPMETARRLNDIDYFPRQAVYVDRPTIDPRYAEKPSAPARGQALGDIGQGAWARRDDYTASVPRWLRNKMTQDADLQARLRNAPRSGPDNLRLIIDDWVEQNARNLDGTPWRDRGIFDWLDDGIDPADDVALSNAIRRKNAAYESLADALRRTPLEFAQQNLPKYGNVFSDYGSYVQSMAERNATANVLLDAMADPRIRVNQAAELVPGGEAYSAADVGKLFNFDTKVYVDDATGRETSRFLEVLAQRLGVSPDDLANISFRKSEMDQFNQKLYTSRAPREARGLMKAVDGITDLFKTLALASVSRHTRDKYSGAFASATQGAFNPVDEFVGGLAASGNYTRLPARLKGTRLYNEVRDRVQADPSLLAPLRRNPLFASMSDDKLVDELVIREYLMESGAQGLTSQTVADEMGRQATNLTMQEAFPGGAGSLFRGLNEKDWRYWRTYVPFQSRGRAGNPNYLLDLSDRVASTTDAMNRGGAYLNRIRKGDSPLAAKRVADMTQVLYGPENFTQFERDFMTRVFPFYRFTKGITPLVFQELTENPAGLTGQSIRLVNRLGEPSEDRHVPEYLRQSAAIPLDSDSIPFIGGLLGVDTPGVTRFLTNIDLPHESLLNLFTPGIANTNIGTAMDAAQNLGVNVLGQSNPLIKGPLEMALNRQFYSGRQLSDLYSVLERPFESVGLGPLGRPLEQLAVNAPGGSRLLGLIRNLSDQRISPQERAAKMLFNTVTGMKVQDVDQDRTVRLAARTMLNDLLDRAPGISTFENLYIKPEDIQRLSPEERRQYLLYRVLQAQSSRERRERANDPLAVLGVR